MSSVNKIPSFITLLFLLDNPPPVSWGSAWLQVWPTLMKPMKTSEIEKRLFSSQTLVYCQDDSTDKSNFCSFMLINADRRTSDEFISLSARNLKFESGTDCVKSYQMWIKEHRHELRTSALWRAIKPQPLSMNN